MAIIERKYQVVVCDICGKESTPIPELLRIPAGFHNTLIGNRLINTCEDCEKKLIKELERLKVRSRNR